MSSNYPSTETGAVHPERSEAETRDRLYRIDCRCPSSPVPTGPALGMTVSTHAAR